ncbi:hypothetical protein A6A40_17205 (plasmid) [Azospirillum humicireducens]|uniref:Uncharacterized protein n=1 Tax=Azospirillum humicireducens TaxID=1226968 RepID=A0A2R4VQV1_9PROT|nr:hypothetical protein [Azospirillum humicireducens]AWB06792.1 hypothetical protein A6A40_17205 [Azospirillum humicireducens]
MSALPVLPPQATWSLIEQLRALEDAVTVRLCLLDVGSSVNVEWHQELHELASRIAKVGPAEALALAMVYDRLGHLPPNDGADRAEYVRSDMNRLLGEVTGWATVVKARRYHARLKDWAAAKPKAPRPVQSRRKGGAL